MLTRWWVREQMPGRGEQGKKTVKIGIEIEV